jgi:LAS superfamily LD-carboxypeptidase LdcB
MRKTNSRKRLVRSTCTVILTGLLTLLSAMAVVSPVAACDEKIVIDLVTYKISKYWCGRRLDSSALAKSSDLVQLPQPLTFEQYRIYVLPETRDAFVAMAAAAKVDSVLLIVDSGFRSRSFQARIIRRRLDQGDSFEKVLQSVAPPGYSEHHTGRALDLCPSEAIFAFSKTYAWLKKNAAKFGFYETLPEDPAAPLTWESWHWTYLGPKAMPIKRSSSSADN